MEEELMAAIRAIKLERPGLAVKALAAELGRDDDLSLVKKLSGKVTKQLASEGLLQSAPPPPLPPAPEKQAAEPASAPKFTCTKCGEAMVEVVATCSICAQRKQDAQMEEKWCQEVPIYCSGKCKRRHTIEHREWHRKEAVALQHKSEAITQMTLETQQQMLSAAKDDYDLGNVAGTELMELDPKAAIKTFLKLTKDRPWEPEAHFNLGAVHMRLQKYAQALVHFDAAFEWNDEGSLGWAQSAIMVHQCIKALRRRKLEHDEPAWHKEPLTALLVGDMCVHIDPEDDGGHQIRAHALEQLGKKQAAKEAASKAKEVRARRGDNF